MLETRLLEDEKMDNLELDGRELQGTLDGLSSINKLFGNTKTTLKAVRKLLLSDTNQTLKIVDLACGGADNLIAIAKWCASQEIAVELVGIDGNQNIIQSNIEKTKAFKNIHFQQGFIMSEDFELPECDIWISSHFMYHFDDATFVQFMIKQSLHVKQAIIFSDLRRHKFAYRLFSFFGPIMPYNKAVIQDGLIAIRRSFKNKEREELLNQASMTKFSIEKKWMFRYILHVDLKKT
jgi:2-polyprenyl-3-methyl-5-hydroxy-6-metoxy-1,4-benzoquinol methylase